jgi:hypothetical protein
MRGIGVFRVGGTLTFASQTNGHDNFFAMDRELARQNANQNFVAVKQCYVPDSSQRTYMRSLPRNVDRTNYTPNTPVDVKRALQRVRNSGCTAPKKKGAILVKK